MRAFNQRHLLVVASLCGSFAAFAACGGDDDTTGSGGSGGTGGSTGGSGGTAGKDGGSADTGGGKGGAAGAGATGGSAGTAGKGGSAGASGSGGAAGKGGSAGAAGSSGKGGAAGGAGDGGMGDASTDGDAGGTANVRVAHLSPGAPPVDFCLAVHGTTVFTGPVLAGQAVPTGLPYASMTKYLSVSAAQYDVRIVAPGSTNCSTSLGGLPDQTNLPAIPAGGAVTIAAIGEVNPGDGGGQPFSLKAYVDDTSVTSGKAKLRFVHASSGTPSVDVGTSGGALFNGIFNDIAFGNTATMTNGYVETAPLADAELSARTHGATSDVLSATGVNVASGSIATAFAIGKVGSTLTPLKVLLCGDNAPPAGALTPCAVVGEDPKRAHVRVAHLSPDAPAVDVCLAKTGEAFTGAGVLRRRSVTTGLAYGQVTTYLDLPLGSYTARLVAATATDCTTAAVPDTAGIAVVDNLYATVAALGDFTVPPTDGGTPEGGAPEGGTTDGGTPPSSFGLKVFVDNKAAPLPAGNINLRFVHASPGTAAVDVGLGSAGSFVPVFTNVGFRDIGAGVEIDPNGYVSRAPLAAQTISARLTGGTTDAIVVPNVTITADSLATAFAIGKVGDASKPLKVLLCLDSSAPVGALTSCSIVP